LLSEPVGEDARDAFASAAAGAIHLAYEEPGAGRRSTRNVEVLWFANAQYLPGRHPLRIAGQGIEVSVGAYAWDRDVESRGAHASAAPVTSTRAEGSCGVRTAPASRNVER
jgi:hypothetical protein